MTERWLPVVGYEDCYEVSDQGRVRSVERQAWNGVGWHKLRGRIRKPHVNIHGYTAVGLCKDNVSKTYVVYQLVARAFLGDPPPGYEVAHLDGDGTNNCLENLAYTTRKVNHSHKRLHGTQPQGKTIYCAKLTEQDVEDIRVLCQLGAVRRRLAEEFGVAPSAITKIAQRKTWAHL